MQATKPSRRAPQLKRLPPKEVIRMLRSIGHSLDRSYRLANDVYLHADETSRLVLQAVFREMMVELRPAFEQTNLIIERNGGARD